MEEGTVKFFNEHKGFGFITREGQDDLFFHVSEIQNQEELKENDEVTFEIGSGKRGELAKNVMRK